MIEPELTGLQIFLMIVGALCLAAVVWALIVDARNPIQRQATQPAQPAQASTPSTEARVVTALVIGADPLTAACGFNPIVDMLAEGLE